MSDISYHHDRNLSSFEGARRGLQYLLAGHEIASLLDVGAGTGNWLRAAQQAGIRDCLGVDGVSSSACQLWVKSDLIKFSDLRCPLNIGRRFDAVLCLEVAEHLPEKSARVLIESLCDHSDLVFFSAASPHQHGEAHLNCQWPAYWQALFNERGYVCRDDVRLGMWGDSLVEPWYRQNLFSAIRDTARAGKEPRIASIIHPEMVAFMDFPESPMAKEYMNFIGGGLHPPYYLRLLRLSVRIRISRLLADRKKFR
jgi:hypothetical protein